MTFGGRLKKARKNIKMTQDELALILGSARPTVSAWENDVFLPGTENVTALAKALNVTVAYLMGETDDSFHNEEKKEDLSLYDENIIRIRILPMEAAASLDESTNINDVVFKEGYPINYIFVNKSYFAPTQNMDNLFCVQIKDNSMQGAQMVKGQLAIIEKTTQIVSGEVMLVNYYGHSFFRWLIVKSEDMIELRPANPDYKSEYSAPENAGKLKVIGQVVGVVNMPHTPQKAF